MNGVNVLNKAVCWKKLQLVLFTSWWETIPFVILNLCKQANNNGKLSTECICFFFKIPCTAACSLLGVAYLVDITCLGRGKAKLWNGIIFQPHLGSCKYRVLLPFHVLGTSAFLTKRPLPAVWSYGFAMGFCRLVRQLLFSTVCFYTSSGGDGICYYKSQSRSAGNFV